MKRNKYGAIEIETLEEGVQALLLATLTELQFIQNVPISDETGMIWKVEPDRNDWVCAGRIVQKYHFYDFVLDEDNQSIRKLLLLDHYYNGSSKKLSEHETCRNYLTFSNEPIGWTCIHWQKANAAAITRMSKTKLANDLGYLIQLVEFKAVIKVLSSLSS